MISTVLEKRASISSGNLTVLDDFWYSVIVPPASSGKAVNRTTAVRLWAFFSCLTLISQTLATFPLKVKRRKKSGGMEDATDHPAFDLLKIMPNPFMTSFNWRESTQGNLICSGNGYSWIERKGGEPVALWPIESQYVMPKRDNIDRKRSMSMRMNTDILYEVNFGSGQAWLVPARDILHVVGFGFNGLMGMPITDYAKETIGNGLSLDEFQGSFFKNGIHTSGVFQHPDVLGDKAAFIEALKAKYSGSANTGVPLVLEEGMTWNQNKISLADQQFIEQRKQGAIEICALFHMPPVKLGMQDVSTSYNSIEQLNKNFVDDTMMQWVVRWEQSMAAKLLTTEQRKDGYTIKFNLDALLRPDAKNRGEIDRIHWMMGTPLNTIRERDDLPPIEGGDTSYVPANFVPASQSGVSKTVDKQPAQDCDVFDIWMPILRQAGEKIVNRETIALKREAKKQLTKRAKSEFTEWAGGFYADLPDKIIAEFTPVLRGFLLQNGEKDDEIQRKVRDFAENWVKSSIKQLSRHIESENYHKILHIADEWEHNRADEALERWK